MTEKKENKALSRGVYALRTIIRWLVYAAAVLLILKAASAAYSFGYAVFSDQTMASEDSGQDVTVIVKEGQSTLSVAKMLKDKGLISDAYVFMVQSRLSAYADPGILPGTYLLNTSETAEEMMAILSQTNTEGQPQSYDSSAGSGLSETEETSSSAVSETE